MVSTVMSQGPPPDGAAPPTGFAQPPPESRGWSQEEWAQWQSQQMQWESEQLQEGAAFEDLPDMPDPDRTQNWSEEDWQRWSREQAADWGDMEKQDWEGSADWDADWETNMEKQDWEGSADWDQDWEKAMGDFDAAMANFDEEMAKLNNTEGWNEQDWENWGDDWKNDMENWQGDMGQWNDTEAWQDWENQMDKLNDTDAWEDWAKTNGTEEWQDWENQMKDWEDWAKTNGSEEWQDWDKDWENQMEDWEDWEGKWNDTADWDDWAKNEDWNETWDDDWSKWEEDWDNEKQQWEDEYGIDVDFNGDWFGDLVNDPCQESCEIEGCDVGEFCLITKCTNPCTGNQTCQQDLTWEWGEWEEYDCSEGVVQAERECEILCGFSDCGEDHASDDICWIEECDDGCDFYNCTIWYQIDGEWYGEYCDEEPEMWFPDFRPGTLFSNVQEFGLAYEDTIWKLWQDGCGEDQECLNGGKQVIDLLNGKLPQQQQVPKNQTEFVSNFVNQAVQDTTAQAAALIQENLGPAIDPYLQDEYLKDVFGGIVDDTQNYMGDEANVDALHRLKRADSTEDIVNGLTEQVTPENMFGMAMTWLGSWFGMEAEDEDEEN